MGKRILLFLATNILVIITLSTILHLVGFTGFRATNYINYEQLALFCLVWGMGGAFISLLMSKMMAKWMMGVKIVDQRSEFSSLVQKIHALARKAGLTKMPEVGVYQSTDLNAFATGPSKNNSLVAVSTGLLNKMNEDEVEGVLAHEISHIANGDMVTMTLLQGVINAFAMFLARIIAFAIDQAMRGDRDDGRGLGYFAYYIVVILFESVFLMLGSIVVASFSRWREFRADYGSAKLAGKDKMIQALQALQRNYPQLALAQSQGDNSKNAFKSMQISDRPSWFALFSSHPPLEARIAALRRSTTLL